MIMNILNSNFKKTTPIFSDEILKVCSKYSKQYVFKTIKKAEEKNEIRCFERGVYYIPEKTFFGQSSISPDQVALKKYIRNGNDVYGIYSGLILLNSFGITTQVPNQIEIITNNETTRRREIQISGRTFVIRKSRCEITKRNVSAYMILQLFCDMSDEDLNDKLLVKKIKSFIDEKNVSIKQLMKLSAYFPGKTIKRMMGCSLFDGII